MLGLNLFCGAGKVSLTDLHYVCSSAGSSLYLPTDVSVPSAPLTLTVAQTMVSGAKHKQALLYDVYTKHRDESWSMEICASQKGTGV